MAGRGSPDLKPIATRARDGDVEGGRAGSPAASSSGVLTPQGRGGAPSDGTPGAASDSSSPWRRFFRGGSRYANSDADSFGNSPRNLMGFSPRAGSARTQSEASTPPRRGKYGGGGGGRGGGGGGGQINAYPPTNPGVNGAAGAVMMSLAEELLTKKGLSLKDLQEDQEEYAETGDKVRCGAVVAAVGGCSLLSLACTALRCGAVWWCFCRGQRRRPVVVVCVHAHRSLLAHSPFPPRLNPEHNTKPLDPTRARTAHNDTQVVIPKEKRPVTKHWNWVGLAIFLYYIASLIYYIVIRATKTLNMGYLGYGVLVLLIEIVSSTATIGYAVLLVKYSKSRRTKGLPIAKKGQSPDLDNLAFHVRVLVPCYKESVELVKITVLGALKAPLPRNTLRTVYLCDDGRDPAKEEMVRELNAEFGCLEYVTGRKRDPNGERMRGQTAE